MTAVIQRVYKADIYTDGVFNGSIGEGLYILLGVSKTDTENDAFLLSEKISKLRIFNDEKGKMNLSVMDIDGEIMIVSNFTLNANYSHGNRPDYFSSADPETAEKLYNSFIELVSKKVKKTATGKFGSDMKTELVTNGPVTIVMESELLSGGKK